MFKRYCVLMILYMLLQGCHPVFHDSKTPVKPHSVTQTRSVSDFKEVQVEGIINVGLHTGYSKPKVILRGDPRDLAHVTVNVSQGLLHVKLGEGYPDYGNVHADIRGKSLHGFTYHGSGVIKGTKMHTNRLDLTIDNNGTTMLGGHLGLQCLKIRGQGETHINDIHTKHLTLDLAGRSNVQLKGIANLASVHMKDNVRLSLYWVNSSILKIRGQGHAYLQLAGIADKLLVELCDFAHFNGRYLRANHAFVKTHDKAIADIAAVQRQHTLASDASNIYFYNLPEMKTDFMAYDGSVLDMRDWSMPYIEQYNHYNK